MASAEVSQYIKKTYVVGAGHLPFRVEQRHVQIGCENATSAEVSQYIKKPYVVSAVWLLPNVRRCEVTTRALCPRLFLRMRVAPANVFLWWYDPSAWDVEWGRR